MRLSGILEPGLAISSSPFAPISVVTAIRYWQEVQKDADEFLMNISPWFASKVKGNKDGLSRMSSFKLLVEETGETETLELPLLMICTILKGYCE